MFIPIEREDDDALYRLACMSDNHDHLNGVITDDNGEVVRYVTVMDILDVFLLDFKKLCGKPGYYTFRVDGDDPHQILMDYDFWIKPEGNGLKEVPLSLS